MQTLLQQYLKTAQTAAENAGNIILEQLGRTIISEKAANSLVTEADYAAQEIIINSIKSRYPDHSFLAEERNLSADLNEKDLWIIDPLDGTNNYAHGIPHFSISIAYSRSGNIEAGIVYDPLKREMFSAIKGLGAFLNGSRIKVSDTASLQQSMIATGFYYDRGSIMRKTLHSIEKLFEANIHGIRRFGSAALDLAWVACGRFDAYFEYKLSPWDFAAGALLVTEAGGFCTDQRAHDFSLASRGIIASNTALFDNMFNIVGQVNS